MRKFFKFLLIILLSGFLLGCGGVLFLFNSAKKGLPDIKKLVENYAPLQPTAIYDINGTLIDRIYIEDREPIAFDKIPQDLKDAFLAIEDKRFYEHNGIDFIRLTKSMFVNVITMRKAQGGSNRNATYSGVGGAIGSAVGKSVFGGNTGAAIGGAIGGGAGAAIEERK